MEIKTDRLRASMVTLTCSKCTRQARFGYSDAADGEKAVARAGWIQRSGLTICPRCPQTRAEITARVKVAHPPETEVGVAG